MDVEPLLGGSSAPDYGGTADSRPNGGSRDTSDENDGVGEIPARLYLSPCQIAVVVVAVLATVLSVAMLAGGYNAILNSAIHEELVIKEGSKAYDMWKATPVPLYLKLYVFNLTNPEEFQNGSKPVLEEVGPYVWREYHEKRNVTFHPNDTVTYLQQRWWTWDQDASGNRSQNDPLITLNTIAVAAAYGMRNSLFLPALDFAFKSVGEELTVSTTARQIVFDGMKDPLLDWIQDNVVNKSGSFHVLYPFFKGTAVAEFDKFAWFYKRNLSLTYDGLFNMMTGEDTLDNLGRIDKWNGRNYTSFYTPPCNEVTGSAGELFSPHLSRKDLVFFSSDLCMSAKLFFKEEVKDYGTLAAYRYSGTNHTFANGTTVPGNECYCVGKTCAPMGLLNAESCRMGAPAFVSFPHFYAADPFLLEGVEGLEPDEKKHSLFLDIVPNLGVPANVSIKLQINIHVTPFKAISLLKSVPDVYLPMLWFEVQGGMTPTLASQTKTLVYFMTSNVPSVVVWSVMIGLAVLAVVVVLVMAWRRNSSYDIVTVSS